MAVSQLPGMGARQFKGGVSFRVWAPCAQAVAVAGSFNEWSESENPLASEANGFWSADVPKARCGDQYKLVVRPGSGAPLWRMDPYAAQIVHVDPVTLNGVVATSEQTYETDSYTTPNWNEMVIYELDIRTFVPGGGYKGTGSFGSAETKLGYLRDLGVNAVEIMPIDQFIGDVSAGYNPAYIFAIEDEFGGPDGFRAFVNAAHRFGIAVIVDVVYNHLGVSAGDMWQFDGWAESPDKGGIYFYNDWRSSTEWGDTRFDYGRGEVRQFLCDNAMRWLQDRFADGLRWDSTGSIRNARNQNNDPANDLPDGWSLMQWINSKTAASQPWKISIAEDMNDNEWITKDVGALGAGFNAQWGNDFVNTLRANLIDPVDGSRDMGSIARILSQKYNAAAFQRVVFSESHDADSNGDQRLPEMIWPGNSSSWASKKRSTLGAAAVMTAPGIPMIFMGQEFLMGGWFDPSVPLGWGNADAHPGIVNLYRDLIALRRNLKGATKGLTGQWVNVFHVNEGDKLVAFHRWEFGGAGDDVVVVLNFGNQGHESYAIGMPRPGLWKARFNSDWQGYDDSFGNWPSYDTTGDCPGADSMPFRGNVGIGPYSAIILSQDQ